MFFYKIKHLVPIVINFAIKENDYFFIYYKKEKSSIALVKVYFEIEMKKGRFIEVKLCCNWYWQFKN